MAVTDLTQAQLETEMAAIKTALSGNDYATARQQLAMAMITVMSFPQNYTIAGHSETVQQELEALKAAIDMHQQAAQGAGATQLGVFSIGRPG